MDRRTDIHKKPFLIIYTGGAYGTFLDWCINYFSGQIEDNHAPFHSTGSAHAWTGCATGDVTNIQIQTIDWWLNCPESPFVLRTHINDRMYQQQEFLNEYAARFQKVILLCNHVDSHLLILQNMLTKVKSIDRLTFLNAISDRFRQQFNAGSDIPRWQLREILSYWHEDWHCFMTDLYQPSDHPMVINVWPHILVQDFEQCIVTLFQQLNIKMCRKSDLARVKNQWLSLQQFKDIDKRCHDIVDAVVNNQNVSTAPCNNDVINEAFVLYKLRVDHGLDFECTGIDRFPVDTQTLKAKTIPYINYH